MATYCGVDFHARQQLVKWCNTDDGAIALGAGVSLKAKLRNRKGKERLLGLAVTETQSRQRQEWLDLISQLNSYIERVEKELELRAEADQRVRLVRTLDPIPRPDPSALSGAL